MVAVIVLAGLLTIAVAVVEGGREAAGRIVRWYGDRKLFRQNRREMRLYY